MCDDSVAAKNYLHIVATYQLRDIAARTSMDDGGTEHKEDLAVARSRLSHLLSNFVNCQDLRFLRRDVALHKGKGFPLTSSLEWLHSDTIMTDNHLIADLYLVHRFTIRAPIFTIYDNNHVHLDPFDVDPLSIQAHLRGQIGGRIEFCRQDAFLLHKFGLDILRVDQHRAELLQLGEDKVKYFIAGRENLESNIARLCFMNSYSHLLYLEVATPVH